MKRTVSRIIAMFIVYDYLINGQLNIDGILDIMKKAYAEEEFEYDKDFTLELVNGVISNQREIDFIISLHLKNYTLDRISYVDRSLLEIGVYELVFTNIPTNIIINEIVEISKNYSEIEGYQSSKFNNAILDAVAKEKRNGK